FKRERLIHLHRLLFLFGRIERMKKLIPDTVGPIIVDHVRIRCSVIPLCKYPGRWISGKYPRALTSGRRPRFVVTLHEIELSVRSTICPLSGAIPIVIHIIPYIEIAVVVVGDTWS